MNSKKIYLDPYEVLIFIRSHGVEPYELCPCTSGGIYKNCCKKNIIQCNNDTERNNTYRKLKQDVWNRRNWSKLKCNYMEGCELDTQKCHSIQKNRFLSQICDVEKKVYHLIPTGNAGCEAIEVKYETTDFASTFNAFCNAHDTDLFSIIEGSSILTFSNEQKYALVYRNYYYMYYKLRIIKSTIIKYSLRLMPKYYQKCFNYRSDLISNESLNHILDMRKNQETINEIKEIINDIEQNYGSKSKKWIINNECLIFSNIRRIKVTNPYFCFQTVREYLSDNEINNAYKSRTLDYYKIKRYNNISTIVLPDVDDNNINVFFAISTKCTSQSPKEFIEKVNNCSDIELINMLNNIILESYEELYFSKEKFYNKLTNDEQFQLSKLLLKKMCAKKQLLYEELTLEPTIPLINVYK